MRFDLSSVHLYPEMRSLHGGAGGEKAGGLNAAGIGACDTPLAGIRRRMPGPVCSVLAAHAGCARKRLSPGASALQGLSLRRHSLPFNAQTRFLHKMKLNGPFGTTLYSPPCRSTPPGRACAAVQGGHAGAGAADTAPVRHRVYSGIGRQVLLRRAKQRTRAPVRRIGPSRPVPHPPRGRRERAGPSRPRGASPLSRLSLCVCLLRPCRRSCRHTRAVPGPGRRRCFPAAPPFHCPQG